MAGGALVAQQQSIPGRIAPIRSRRSGGGRAVAPHRLPVEQPQPKPVRRLVPLQPDRGAVAEHHEPLQPAFALQLAKAQQGSQGLARTRSSVDQHVLAAWPFLHQARPQQLDQLALPLAGLHLLRSCSPPAGAGPPAELKGKRGGRGIHGGHCGIRSRQQAGQMSDLAYGRRGRPA